MFFCPSLRARAHSRSTSISSDKKVFCNFKPSSHACFTQTREAVDSSFCNYLLVLECRMRCLNVGGLRKTGERLSHCLGGPENVSQTSPIKKLAKNISEETMVSYFYFAETAGEHQRTCCLGCFLS